MKRTLLIIFSTIYSLSTWSYCPTPPTEVDAKILATVEFDGVSKLFTYKYEVVNSKQSKLDIGIFGLYLNGKPTPSKTPVKWSGSFYDYQDRSRTRFSWSSNLTKVIRPGESKGEFVLRSKLGPGPVEYYVIGESKLPKIEAPVNGDSEVEPNCPGFFYDRSFYDGYVLGSTIGPVSSEVVTAKLRYKNKNWNESNPPVFKSGAKGKIKVLLLGSESLDVEKIKPDTIHFIRGGAKPLEAKIVNGNGEGEGEDKSLKGKEHKKNLLLKFNMEDIDIRCNLDYALFLVGKVGTKSFKGALPMRPVKCTKEHLIHEENYRKKNKIQPEGRH